MKKLILLSALIIVAVASIVGFTSCQKIYDPVTHRDRLQSILLSTDTLNMYVGETRQLPLSTTPADYHLDSLKLKSSDSTVLSISATGLLTAKKVGLATITISNLANTISISGLVTVVAPTPDSLKMGLLAYYPFNNSAADSSGNGNNGTIFNVSSTTDRHGKANSAYYFDGATSYITVNDNAALRLSATDFTLNMWIDLDSYTNLSGSALLSKNSGAYGQGWNCSIVGYGDQDGASLGVPFYNVSGGPDPFAAGNKRIDTAKWSMLTITYQVSKQKITFYINGAIDSSVVNIASPNADTNAKLHIGNNSLLDIPEFNAPGYYLKGKLDEIRIYNRIISTNEINKLYTSTK
jgi:hypothetical protein